VARETSHGRTEAQAGTQPNAKGLTPRPADAPLTDEQVSGA
jgi:hypothetical protein